MPSDYVQVTTPESTLRNIKTQGTLAGNILILYMRKLRPRERQGIAQSHWVRLLWDGHRKKTVVGGGEQGL